MTDCKYCQIVEKKKNLVYEDDKLIAVVPENPLTKGHILVIPKKHIEKLQDIEDKDVEHLFYAASFSATSLFENMEAQGTNIIANTGGDLCKGGHFHIDVLARKTDDSLNFLWTPKKLPDPDMDAVKSQIKDKCDMLGVETKEASVVDLDKKDVETIGPGTEDEKPESSGAEEGEKASEDKKQMPEAVKDEAGDAEEGEKKEEKPSEDEGDADSENYLVKQLRRVP